MNYSNFEEFKSYIDSRKYHQKHIEWLLNLEDPEKDLNVTDMYGRTPLSYLLSPEHKYSINQMIMENDRLFKPNFNINNYNTRDRAIELLNRLLDNESVDVNYEGEYPDENDEDIYIIYTPLTSALQNISLDKRYLEIVNKLLDRADIDVNNGDIKYNEVPLLIALLRYNDMITNKKISKEEFKEILKKLIKKGADLNVKVNRLTDYYGPYDLKTAENIIKNLFPSIIEELNKEKVDIVGDKLEKDLSARVPGVLKNIKSYLGGKKTRKNKKVKKMKKSKKVKKTMRKKNINKKHK